ncbi:MAG: DegV family EDD domain-containing protein [Candidatus Heimdallarchaeota archaeon]|nr:DegV family EDD domain-containing protein [Candidatus Heimdallarchaeota archaeon]
MKKVAIITDGSCELPDDLIERYDIDVVPLAVIFEKTNERFYVTGESGTMSKDLFYKKLRQEIPKTDVPLPKVFYGYFMEAAKKADSVIAIFVSNKLSKVILNAKSAVSGIHDKDITIVDSCVGGPALGLLVLEAAKMAQDCRSKGEILQSVNDLIPQVSHTAILDTLNNIYRSGRVGWLRKSLGEAFKIKPILHFENGETSNGGNFRGREEVLNGLKRLAPYALKHSVTDEILIWHSRNIEEAEELKETLSKNNRYSKNIRIIEAGPIIGGYMGEKMLGLIYLGDFKDNWLLGE